MWAEVSRLIILSLISISCMWADEPMNTHTNAKPQTLAARQMFSKFIQNIFVIEYCKSQNLPSFALCQVCFVLLSGIYIFFRSRILRPNLYLIQLFFRFADRLVFDASFPLSANQPFHQFDYLMVSSTCLF